MKTRIIHTSIWEDEWFYNLSRDGRDLFFYCITNPRINLSGMYQLSDRVILSDLRYVTDLEAAKKELSGKVEFFEGWVYVKNSDRFSGFSGIKNEVAKQKELSFVPTHIFNTLYGVDNCVNKSVDNSENNTLLSTSDRVFEIENTSINKKSEIRNKKSADTVSDGFEMLRKTAQRLGGLS